MPLMREWVEIHVDEDLLIHVVRELLSLAVNPNQVDITHGTNGRVILAEIHLAEAWYQLRLAKEQEDDAASDGVVEAYNSDFEVVAPSEVSVTTKSAPRTPAPKPSASPNGEDS